MRIFIVPVDPENLYFYKLGNGTETNDENFIEVRKNGQSITVYG